MRARTHATRRIAVRAVETLGLAICSSVYLSYPGDRGRKPLAGASLWHHSSLLVRAVWFSNENSRLSSLIAKDNLKTSSRFFGWESYFVYNSFQNRSNLAVTRVYWFLSSCTKIQRMKRLVSAPDCFCFYSTYCSGSKIFDGKIIAVYCLLTIWKRWDIGGNSLDSSSRCEVMCGEPALEEYISALRRIRFDSTRVSSRFNIDCYLYWSRTTRVGSTYWEIHASPTSTRL